ncbi:MAG: leucyl aminopeptidase [Parcubacteria group bacterium]|nr:leucyl aminopeptidase [Parcubacteria group bacterium]
MKIKFSETKAEKLAKQITKIELIEGTLSKIVEDKEGVVQIKIGIGKRADITQRRLRIVVRKMVRIAKANKQKKISFDFDSFQFKSLSQLKAFELASLIAENMDMANFEFTKFKTEPKEGWLDVEEVTVCGSFPKSIKDGFTRGQTVAHGVNSARDLANTPGGDMTPALLALSAKSLVKGLNVSVKILSEKDMEKLKMGAILGVARGSDEEAKFIVMEYWGAVKSKAPLVYIGKGVTFDSGGINIKPGDGATDMKMDMAGGAVVIGAISTIAKLKLKQNVVALIPAVENMVSGASYRPGDVLTSMSGKTIEVLNTDAEGRVVLADALTYSRKYKPACVIDVATLTGAVLIALGQHASAVLTADEKLRDSLVKLGEESGDYMWPLPLWEEYAEYTKGQFGDVANIPLSNSRYGGVINGGMFLKQFAGGLKWAHIDMASRMTTITSDQLAPGAAGEPVRLLVKFAEEYK